MQRYVERRGQRSDDAEGGKLGAGTGWERSEGRGPGAMALIYLDLFAAGTPAPRQFSRQAEQGDHRPLEVRCDQSSFSKLMQMQDTRRGV